MASTPFSFVDWLDDKLLIPLAAFLTDFLSASPTAVIKASVLSAHDKGSHAEVHVKVRKVLHSGRATLSLGTISIYPLSWTSRGCTCPILNPGKMCLNNSNSFLLGFFGFKSWEMTTNCERIKVQTDFLSPPGMDYLLAGPEEAGTGRLLVTMQSVVVPWTPRLGLLISEGLRNGCPWTLYARQAGHSSLHLQGDAAFSRLITKETGKCWTTCCPLSDWRALSGSCYSRAQEAQIKDWLVWFWYHI